MFTGLLNYIDQLYLSHYEKKLAEVKASLDAATKERSNLLIGLKCLCEVKYAGSRDDVVYCNKIWVGLREIDRMIKETEGRIRQLTHEDYEKYGTAHAAVKRRMTARNAKIVGQRSFGSSVI